VKETVKPHDNDEIQPKSTASGEKFGRQLTHFSMNENPTFACDLPRFETTSARRPGEIAAALHRAVPKVRRTADH
jgi:hypothetical protein